VLLGVSEVHIPFHPTKSMGIQIHALLQVSGSYEWLHTPAIRQADVMQSRNVHPRAWSDTSHARSSASQPSQAVRGRSEGDCSQGGEGQKCGLRISAFLRQLIRCGVRGYDACRRQPCHGITQSTIGIMTAQLVSSHHAKRQLFLVHSVNATHQSIPCMHGAHAPLHSLAARQVLE
jgi:hypothetical protein